MSQATDEPLPLLEGLLRWSDPALVEAVRAKERRLTEFGLSGLIHRPRLSRVEELRPPDTGDWMGGPANLGPVIDAWRELERAFRRRIARGELHVTGVMAAPTRSTQRTQIPGVWAADFEFDLLTDTITVGDERYVNVVVSAENLPKTGEDMPQPALQAVNEKHKETAVPDAGKRRGGRPPADPDIRAALNRYWDYVNTRASRLSGNEPVWAEIARGLHNRLARDAQLGLDGKLVAEETLRKHLGRIYREMVVEKAAPPGIAQKD